MFNVNTIVFWNNRILRWKVWDTTENEVKVQIAEREWVNPKVMAFMEDKDDFMSCADFGILCRIIGELSAINDPDF